MKADMKLIYERTWAHYQKAKENIIEKRMLFEYSDPISDVIPGFESNKLEFGSFDQENFVVMFVDMRRSTERARSVGAKKTFLTMHIFLTSLIQVVGCYHGKVIDIMGDGIMVFWGGREARKEENMVKSEAVRNAGNCGLAMLKVRNEVINKIIRSEELGDDINLGIGITFDSVIVTKIGIPGSYDVKAFGDCINTASKYSQCYNKIKVSKKVKDIWPSSKNGKLMFKSDDDGGYFIE